MLKLLIRRWKKTKSTGNCGRNEVEEAAELTTPAKESVPTIALSILNETSEPVNTPSPKLTYAEKDRKDLEAKLQVTIRATTGFGECQKS